MGSQSQLLYSALTKVFLFTVDSIQATVVDNACSARFRTAYDFEVVPGGGGGDVIRLLNSFDKSLFLQNLKYYN